MPSRCQLTCVLRGVLELPEMVVCACAPCSLSLRLFSLVVLLNSPIGRWSEGSPSMLLDYPARTEYRMPLHFPACPEYHTTPRFFLPPPPSILQYVICRYRCMLFVLLYSLVGRWRGGCDPGSGTVVPPPSLPILVFPPA